MRLLLALCLTICAELALPAYAAEIISIPVEQPPAAPDDAPITEIPVEPMPTTLPPQPGISAVPVPVPTPAPGPKPPEAPFNLAVLRALNKVTAHAETLSMPIGVMTRFGNLEIVALACWSAPAEEQPENAILLDVHEIKPNEAPERVFAGWIFSSSPSLSSMEHAVYDLTATGCRRDAVKEPTKETGNVKK